MKELKTYEQFMDAMNSREGDGMEMDQEERHMHADSVLIQLALNTYLSKEQRRSIVDVYLNIDKWFS
jgi:hypothetical protein